MFKKTLLVLAIVTLLLLSTCDNRPRVVDLDTISDSPGENTKIFIVSHGWHTGIILPFDKIALELPRLKDRFGATPFIEIGWGDKGFYQSKEITTDVALQATFWPTEAVIHAVAVPLSPQSYFPGSEVQEVCLSGQAYASLNKFIANSFFRQKNGDVVIQRDGLYGDSQFYTGVGKYYLMNTCNKWTAKGLKSAGLDINPTFKLSADSVMEYLREQQQILDSTTDDEVQINAKATVICP